MGYWWLRPLQATIKGATITLGSTVISCGLAIQVEKHTNRMFFYMAPHWYANVEYAYGITDEQLASVRHLRVNHSQYNPNCVPSTATAISLLTTAHVEQQQEGTPSPTTSTDVLLVGDTTTKFVIPHDRGDATAPKAVVVIPLGDIMSNALTG